jgi:hypothetical protein
MAKKPVKPIKKAAKPAKKAASAKKPATTVKKPPVPAGKTTSAWTPDDEVNLAPEQQVALLPVNLFEDTIEGLTSLMEDFREVADNNLRAIERRRKIGAGIRNYGFIEKVADLAQAKPQFAQFFRPVDLRNCIQNLDMCREVVLLLQSFTRMASNTMLIYSDEAFRMALIYYNMVKEMSRRGDPAAMELYRMLLPYFKKPRRPSCEPTEKEIEHDLHALIHGKKDGKIVVENVKPKLTGGTRKVLDEKFNRTAQFKDSEQGELENN